MLHLFEDLGRQTDGSLRVASNGAIFDADTHWNPPVDGRGAYANRAMSSRSQVIDPPHVINNGGGGGGWAWLVTARGIIEAQLIRGVLEDSGVSPVWLDTFDPSPGAWMFMSGNPNAPVPVFVPLSLLDAARLALMDSGLSAPEAEAVSSGTQIQAERPGWRSMRWAYVAMALAVLMIIIFLLASLSASVTSG